MNFPWMCSSLSHNFSEIIEDCFASPIKYLNYDNEEKVFLDALKVVLEEELKLERLYPKNKPIFRRPINPLALKPNLIEKNMRKILHQKKLEKFFDEKTYVYEKPQGFDVGVVKVQKGVFQKEKKRMYSPQNNDKEEDRLLENRTKSFYSSKSFNDSVSPKQKTTSSKENSIDERFYITDDFLNLTNLIPFSEQQNEVKFSPKQKMYFLPYYGTKWEIECSKILNKSRLDKDKLKKITDNKEFVKKNRDNVLPRLTQKIFNHTNKEIRILEHQQKDLVQEFNKYYNIKFAFILISIHSFKLK